MVKCPASWHIKPVIIVWLLWQCLSGRPVIIVWLLWHCLSGKLSWSREEALSSILSIELVDLPVSQIMAKMEDEFGANDGENVMFLATVNIYVYWGVTELSACNMQIIGSSHTRDEVVIGVCDILCDCWLSQIACGTCLSSDSWHSFPSWQYVYLLCQCFV